jgi:hypothetical protein
MVWRAGEREKLDHRRILERTSVEMEKTSTVVLLGDVDVDVSLVVVDKPSCLMMMMVMLVVCGNYCCCNPLPPPPPPHDDDDDDDSPFFFFSLDLMMLILVVVLCVDRRW